MKKTTSIVGALTALSLLAAGCAGTRAAKKSEPSAGSVRDSRVAPIETGLAADMEPDVREMATRAVPDLKVVNFPYDSDLLDEPARETLKGNAAYLKAHASMKIQVAGNCDQRGTVAYNLALGQRRAAAVRSYYNALGVAKSRVATISYGKEKPVCVEEGESCWARNRRAATLEVLNPAVAGRPAP